MKSSGPIFAALFVASILLWVGAATLALGLILFAMRWPMWIAGSGALLTATAIASRYVLARVLRAVLDRISDEGTTLIYMPLVGEGTDLWRPVQAMKIGELGYMVTENAPPDEIWAFQPGHLLKCEARQLSQGVHLTILGKAE